MNGRIKVARCIVVFTGFLVLQRWRFDWPWLCATAAFVPSGVSTMGHPILSSPGAKAFTGVVECSRGIDCPVLLPRPRHKKKHSTSRPKGSSALALSGSSSPADPDKQKTKRTKKKRKKKDSGPTHWTNESDIFLFEQDNTVRFTVRGNPLPLRRHRTSRGFMYNPSAKAQEAFRKIVRDLLPGSNTTEPLFGNETSLAITLVFRTQRPKKDFVGGKPGDGRLRPFEGEKLTAPSPLLPALRSDVDNLAKFVLDAMNGLLYEDDRQVVSLHATKFRDSADECLGSTEVFVRVIREDDLERLLERSFELY